ncbi:HAMP domain-containing histidine kinase [Taibaiella lutea]|uniref:histidine kinase n=1 Tax=Taibaiella lutea TaxID=2608001 RepID=A0A5M6CP08_9BACT|nr:HAMP domain-containing sensor histidine kinase [Taibaiella lutea]KAA5534985.1 HAMP domain-containing histidine kinase [Taibaiella lutea]
MKHNKGKYKLKHIRLLMVAGYLLLVIFAGQWLMTQYDKDENSLQKELSKLFDHVQEGITDSLLLVSITDPGKQPVSTKSEATLMLNDDTLNRLSSLLYKENNKDLTRQGVTMMVRKVRQLTPGEKQVLFHIDTSVFNNDFANDMRRKGWNFPVEWVTEAKGNKVAGNAIFIPNRFIQSGHGVLISDYRNYLLKGLWPQAAFVFVLLSVILLAFYITYLSLLRQIQLSSMKDDFVSNISHELKTPIATVKVALEAIQHFEAAGQKEYTAEYMHMASLEMERLELLVNRSLHTSLLESGRLSLQLEQANIRTIIEDVLLAYQVKFLAYEADVHFEIKGTDFDTMVDKLHLQGVLVNLLDNSLKYGQGKISISVELTSFNGKVNINVTDNGPGIPEEYRKKVFEKFFRVPMHNRHNVKGYGLGLTYAAQVMEQHNGKISVVNVPQGGCTFTVSL